MMTGMGFVIVLLVLALLFGVGGLAKGLLWGVLIAVALLVVAGLLGRSSGRR